jgi:GNAT superfamily N-acetyltransferase
VVTIQTEKWATFYPDGSSIFPEHHKELALYPEEIPLSIDEAKYELLDKADILLIVTARDEGRLVGYWLWFIMPHPHYAAAGPMALTDMYFVLPEYRRGVGAKLEVASEAEYTKRGCVKAITSCKAHRDHRPFFERLGWELSDYTMVKLLKKGA